LNLTRVGLEDFEIGKILHRWPQRSVCRARQKSLDRPVLVWIEEKTGAPAVAASFQLAWRTKSMNKPESRFPAAILGKVENLPPQESSISTLPLYLASVVRHPEFWRCMR